MKADDTKPNRRILIVDDNQAIHGDIRKILCPPAAADSASLDALSAELFGAPAETAPKAKLSDFTLDSAYQGQEALAMVQRAVAEGRPYAMAFVDVRMPPGWDGVETTLELWRIAPDLQIVICTAYSDYSWDEMLEKFGGSDRLLVLKKPFDAIEVLQLASSLTQKWHLLQSALRHAQDLEERVYVRTAELRSANTSLQEEIGRRAQIEADLQRAKEAAEAADRAKSAFLANMSHEIRTPMNGVIGMTDVLLASRLNTEQRDIAETLAQSGLQLLSIIKDILDFSKIEAGHIQLEEIDFRLADQLGTVLDIQAQPAQSKGLELVLDIDAAVPPCVRGDPVRLHQILLNIVGNAIKFTAKGEVAISVTSQPGTEGRTRLHFEVTDTGIGIPADVQANLFKPFVQADTSTTRRFGGTGLGLAICKRLVELMHGDIGVRSVPNQGSTFWFNLELPLAQEIPVPRYSTTTRLESYRTLVVDDSPTNRKLLTHLLGAWCVPHTLASSAAEALEILRSAASAGTPFDLVILDYVMPEMDGLMLADAINADRTFSRPVLVLLTSRGEQLTAAEIARHGLAACELKPIRADKLHETLVRALGAHVLPGHDNSDTEPRKVRAENPILVAEDNPVNQKVAFLLLRQLGYSVDIVNNGREAIDALRQKSYSLVLMDAQMPVLDGFAATREIRAAQAAGDPTLPAELCIIAMTANAMPGDREACLDAGMDDYISKPVKPDALAKMLSRFLTPLLSPSSGDWAK